MTPLYLLCSLCLLPLALSQYLPPMPIPFTTRPPLRQDSYSTTPDFAIAVDAANSELVFDLLNPANMEEVGQEGGEVFYQVVPGIMGTHKYSIAPCGVAIPHFHSDGDAINYVMEWNAQAEVGYVEADGSTVTIKNIKKGNTFRMARGTLHWVVNKSCTETLSGIQFFNSPDIAATRPDLQIGSIPEEILIVSMGEEVAALISDWAVNKPNVRDMLVLCPRCVQECGL
eukprot:GFUD01021260.1.p1 GENE.GFUD01021260.1~~GFUD01021260.1.p1  ORF type:complete len:228 (+),score=37.99 GFUD01021260.1:156-839(+)